MKPAVTNLHLVAQGEEDLRELGAPPADEDLDALVGVGECEVVIAELVAAVESAGGILGEKF